MRGRAAPDGQNTIPYGVVVACKPAAGMWRADFRLLEPEFNLGALTMSGIYNAVNCKPFLALKKRIRARISARFWTSKF